MTKDKKNTTDNGTLLAEKNNMSVEKYKHLKSLLRHIKNVQSAAELLGERLMEKGEVQLAINLIKTSMEHDQSKFHGIEWESLTRVEEDKELLKLSLKQHVEVNEHHPEHWGGIAEMPRLFIAEMVCDCFARSTEMGTDLRQWIKDVAMKKYEMTPRGKSYKIIKEFLDLLLDDPFGKVK